MAQQAYWTVRQQAQAELTDRRSRFLAVAAPVADEQAALELIAARKKQFWDARHTVYAYSLRNGIHRFSDDGEPQGTAGLPVLEVLQKQGITDCVVAVTRYFGGILLGTGGLVRAYSQSAAAAVTAAVVGECRPCIIGTVQCSYAQYGRVEPLVHTAGGRVTDTAFADEVTLSVLLPAEVQASFCAQLTDVSAGTLELAVTGEQYEFFEKKDE